MSSHKFVKQPQIERSACIIDKCLDVVFRQMIMLAMLMIMVVMMLMLMFMLLMFMFVIMVMMLMFFMLILLVIIVIMVVVVACVFHFLNPRSRSSRTVEIKQTGMQYFLKRHVAEIGFYDLCGRLNSANNGFYVCEFLFAHFCRLVQQNNIAELDLLGYQRSQVFFLGHVSQFVAVSEFVTQAQSVHYRANAVEHRKTVLSKLRNHLGVRT